MKTSLNVTNFIFDKLCQFPSLIGLRVGDENFSYKQITEYSLQTASVLKHLGVKKEAVGLIGQRTASSYFGILGIIFGLIWQKIKEDDTFPFAPALVVSFVVSLVINFDQW